jgi:hypothetical protein
LVVEDVGLAGEDVGLVGENVGMGGKDGMLVGEDVEFGWFGWKVGCGGCCVG